MDIPTLRAELESHHAACFSWAVNCCERDRSEAEEVLQNVYLMILEGRARFDGRSSLRTWLFAVIRRTAAGARRGRALRWLRFVPMSEQEHAQERSEAEADAATLESEQHVIVERALASLPARQREVLLLVFYHDRTVDEAAGILGIGLGSARTHYARGKQRLRTLLSPTLVPDGARP